MHFGCWGRCASGSEGVGYEWTAIEVLFLTRSRALFKNKTQSRSTHSQNKSSCRSPRAITGRRCARRLAVKADIGRTAHPLHSRGPCR
jgi:hypothetical protein